LSRIVNADKSMGLVFWQLRKTVAEKWVESVKKEIHGDAKAGLTLVGSITANSDRLPLFLITRGVTTRCHSQFGRSFPGSIDHSKGGWVDQECAYDSSLSFVQTAGWVRLPSSWINFQVMGLQRHM
jgi:hypothetical protein